MWSKKYHLERNYTTASRVRFSVASTAFYVLGMRVMSTGVAGASVATLVMAGWECGVLAMLDGVVIAVGGLCVPVVGGDDVSSQLCQVNKHGGVQQVDV